MSAWHSFSRGDAKVSFGQPYYGKQKIVANAPLSRENFGNIIAALEAARDAYEADRGIGQSPHPESNPSAPQRIQRRRTAGWRMPECAAYVGRPTKFGNPWSIGADGLVLGPGMFFSADPDTASQHVVALYADWLNLGVLAPALLGPGATPRLTKQRALILVSIHELRGRDLACWCPLDQPCHADVLLELANA